MDVSNRSRPHLPPLSFLDEKSEDTRSTATTTSAMGTTTHTVTALASPTYPPHTGSASAHFNPPYPTMKPWSSTSPSVHTPPESRRASGDEKDAPKPAPAARQMLPSLSEIMRVETPTFASAAPPPPSLLAGGHLPPRQPASNMSPPSPTSRRPLPVTSGSTLPLYASTRSEPPTRSAYPAAEPMQSAYGRSEEGRPPAPSSFGGFREHSPHAPAHPEPAMGPPTSVPYGYAPYQSRHDSHAQPPAGAHYPPAPMYAAPPPVSAPAAAAAPAVAAPAAAPAWKTETKSSILADRPRHDSYKDTVKRLLDVQHVEYALSEISQHSNILSNFANQFREQLYAAQQRPGTTPQHLPNVADLDEMATKAKIQLDQLLGIREFIATQQQAAVYNDLQQQQQQHHHAVGGRLPEKHGLAPGETSPHNHPHDGHPDDRHHGGFGPDAKKPRRGRAAPPGRCHSCNRAETPEWRRGPDGARTLCNACGLHYAKLTRKNNNSNGQNSGSSAAAAVAGKPSGLSAVTNSGLLVGKDGR